MSNSTTEQQQKSKDKSIIQSIGYKEFSAICDEYKVVETATKKLLDIAEDIDTQTREKIGIYKWMVEMNIGRPKQMEEVKGGDDTIEGITVEIVNPREEEC